MRVLLTGAFGNVGVSALEALIQQGHIVRCFDLQTRANEKIARRFGDQIEVVWGDLRRPEDVAAAVHGQEAVIHLAFIIPKMSVTGVECESHPDWAREVNVGGTRNLLDAITAQPTPPKLIFASSLHVYGQTQELPPPRTVSDPVQPIEHYAHHKVECEQMVQASGLKWTICRFGAVLPLALRLDPGMFDVPLDNRIEFVHTRDVGLALANAVTSDRVNQKIMLLGGGPHCQFHFREIVERILGNMGIGMLPEAAFGTIPFCTDWLDTSESQEILQFQQHTFDDYVQEMLDLMGFRKHLARIFRPIVRRQLLRQSPYYRAATGQQSKWEGQIAVVTGASSGIGAAMAKRLAKEGLTVVMVARRLDRLQELATHIRGSGGHAHVIVADLTEETERMRVYEEVHATYGSVDVLINNAGVGWYGFGTEMSWSLARQMIQTNMSAVVHLTLLFLADMKTRNRGHVINIGSVVGSLPSQGVALYGATKSFLDNFSTALYRELRGTNVHVSIARPGAVTTAFYNFASQQAEGIRALAEKLAVKPKVVVDRIWDLIRRPRRVVYAPRILVFVPWIEPFFGWLIDRLGPMLLRRQLRSKGRV